jgi:eukaryotic-like serine/threonine-protein kinase
MNDRQWQELWEIYRSVKELPDGRRRQYLESLSGDPEILLELAGLLEEPLDGSMDADESLDGAPPEPASRAGTRFGRYEIAELLGSGGMGQVYAAHDIELGRPAAVKFLSPDMASSRSAVQRLMREAKAISALNHPHIVTVYEVTHSGDDTAIAMELVAGEPLRSFCGEPVEVRKLADWGRQIAQALAAAHQQDIVHRDIKPENVMVRQDGILKVLDFGLARQVGGLGQASHSSAMLAGTLRYMAPEQIAGEGVTSASDIFSLGIVLYELAAGRHPFGGGSVIDTAHTIAHTEIKGPSWWNRRLPPGFDALLLAMLHKDPRKRPSARDVERRLSELDVTARPIPWRWMMLVATVSAATAGIWFFPFREKIFPRKDPIMTQLTSQVHEDQVTAAAISPDGKTLAFAALGGSVYLRRMTDGFSRPLGTPAGLRVDRISWFSSQSKLLLSGSQETDGAIEHYQPGAWVMPLNGDEAVKVIENGRDAVPSPDGERIAFTSGDQSSIWLSKANGEDRRRLTNGGQSSIFTALIWSPDGRRVAFGRQDYAATADRQAYTNYHAHWNYRYSYQSIAIETGLVTARIDDLMMTSACGLPDGRVFFLRSVSVETLPENQLWEMRTDLGSGRALGSPRQVTHLQDSLLANISASNDGREAIATVGANGYPNIYVADLSPTGRPSEHQAPRMSNVRRLTYTLASDYPHAWTPDNQAVIFESSPNSHFDLFRQRIDRRDREPLVVSPEMKVMAQLTPDAQWLLFHQFAGQGSWKIMRVRPQGGTPEAVLPEGAKVEFRCGIQRGARCVLRTTDGNQYVFYEFDAIRGKGRELARTARTVSIVGDWDVSPDGSQVAIPVHDTDRALIRLLNLDSRAGLGRETTVAIGGLLNLSGVVWAADGRGWLVASRAEHGWILSYADCQGNKSDLLEATGQIFAVPSPDGRHVAFPLWNETFNAWLFRGI